MSEQRVVVMGLGNLLWADSACGWRNGCMTLTHLFKFIRLSMAVLRD